MSTQSLGTPARGNRRAGLFCFLAGAPPRRMDHNAPAMAEADSLSQGLSRTSMPILNPLPQRYLTGDPGIGGKIKVRPEDFLVDELPLYEPEGKGEHLYLGIQKTNVSHGELMA